MIKSPLTAFSLITPRYSIAYESFSSLTGNQILRAATFRRVCSVMAIHTYTCSVDAEPLHRYCLGGYHPVHLGDRIGDNQYKILHKLGWGGYSTVWAARDEVSNRNVAIKIKSAESSGEMSQEVKILRDITSECNAGQGSPCIVQYLNHFQVEGPNGLHTCLVTELLGPSIPDVLDTGALKDHRLPAQWVKSITRQLLAAVSQIHSQGIGHGDVHTRNIVFKDTKWDSLSSQDLISLLGSPQTAPVIRKSTDEPSTSVSALVPLDIRLPRYLVSPTSFRISVTLSQQPTIRLIDFGEAFTADYKPETLHTPLALRAPEVIFEDDWDMRVDLWSTGCTIFELLTGQPPFDTIMITKDMLIDQMIEEIGELPDRWVTKRKEMIKAKSNVSEDEEFTLEGWLKELYLDEGKTSQLTVPKLDHWARILRLLMRFEPRTRLDAAEVLQDEWFREENGA